MKHYINSALFVMLVAAILFTAFSLTFFLDNGRAAVAVLTIGGLVAMVLYAATHSSELG